MNVNDVLQKGYTRSMKKQRKRWNRFLGQKCRIDRDCWVDLLNCNWSSWANEINRRVNMPQIDIHSDRRHVYYCFQNAILEATFKDFIKLDNLYCQEYLL